MPKSPEQQEGWWIERSRKNQTLSPEDQQTVGMLNRADYESPESDHSPLREMAKQLDELDLIIGTTAISHLKWEAILNNTQRLQIAAFRLGEMCGEQVDKSESLLVTE